MVGGRKRAGRGRSKGAGTSVDDDALDELGHWVYVSPGCGARVRFGDVGVAWLPAANELGEKGAQTLVPALLLMPHMTSLNVEGAYARGKRALVGRGVTSVCVMVVRTDNALGEEGARALVPALLKMPSMRSLNVQGAYGVWCGWSCGVVTAAFPGCWCVRQLAVQGRSEGAGTGTADDDSPDELERGACVCMTCGDQRVCMWRWV